MTVSEIQSRVYVITGLPSAHPRLTTTVINSLWWDGAVKMAREARPGYLRRDDTQNLVAGQAAYFLPVDALVILAVKAYEGGQWCRLEKRTQEELDDLDPDWESTGTGSAFYYDAGIHSAEDADYGKRVIQLAPVPMSTVTNGLKVRDVRRPVALSAVPSGREYIDIPADYHEGLCNYAAWKFLRNSSENPRQDIAELLQIFQADLQAFVRNQKEENEFDHEPRARLPFASASLGYWGSL